MDARELIITALAERHPGLTSAIGDGYAEAARVCLARHHEPPTIFTVDVGDESTSNPLRWEVPDDRTLRAWANETDATRDGAYAISLAAIEARENMVAIHRAENLSGADYYVAPPGSDPDDLENSFRLEVSGTDVGNMTVVRQRLLQKQEQTRAGRSNIPAIASVVGFKETRVAIARVEEE